MPPRLVDHPGGFPDHVGKAGAARHPHPEDDEVGEHAHRLHHLGTTAVGERRREAHVADVELPGDRRDHRRREHGEQRGPLVLRESAQRGDLRRPQAPPRLARAVVPRLCPQRYRRSPVQLSRPVPVCLLVGPLLPALPLQGMAQLPSHARQVLASGQQPAELVDDDLRRPGVGVEMVDVEAQHMLVRRGGPHRRADALAPRVDRGGDLAVDALIEELRWHGPAVGQLDRLRCVDHLGQPAAPAFVRRTQRLVPLDDGAERTGEPGPFQVTGQAEQQRVVEAAGVRPVMVEHPQHPLRYRGRDLAYHRAFRHAGTRGR